jgi:hypothetical protein
MIKVTRFMAAAAVSALAVFGLVSPSAAQFVGEGSRTIILDEVDVVTVGHGKTQRREGHIMLQTYGGQIGVAMRFDVIGLLSLCHPRRPDILDQKRKFYALYVETTTVPRIRVMTFNTECVTGSFRAWFVHFPPEAPVIPYFFQPITFEVIMEADDGFDGNVNPIEEFELRGTD